MWLIKWIQGNKSSVKYTEIPHLECNQLCCLLRLLALFSLSQVYDLILQAPQLDSYGLKNTWELHV